MHSHNDQINVTIILPTYNGAPYIKDALDSIAMQNDIDYEVIIVNDGSTDNTTAAIIDKYCLENLNFRAIHLEKNQGIAKSLNIGFSKAKGKYLSWTSDDNTYKLSALKFMFDFLEANQQYDFLTCQMDYIDFNTNKNISKYYKKPIKTVNLAGLCNIGACFLYRRSLKDRVGEYNDKYLYASDYDYWCRAALSGNIFYSSRNLYNYFVRSTSLTSVYYKQIKQETANIHKKKSEKILAKYKTNFIQKSSIYYSMWRYDPSQYNYLIKCILANPLGWYFIPINSLIKRFCRADQ